MPQFFTTILAVYNNLHTSNKNLIHMIIIHIIIHNNNSLSK